MQLHEELLSLRKKENELGTQILEKLQEMEDSRQYIGLGYSSLFDYLVRGLSYSESAAYQKQSCLRLTKELPEIKLKIESGVLTTTGLSMAFKSLKTKTLHEKRILLNKIENRTSREIKQILIQEEIAPPIRIQKTEYQDRVILRLELTKEQNQKLEKLKAYKSHRGNLAMLLEDMLDRELKGYENQSYRPSRSKNPRFITATMRNVSTIISRQLGEDFLPGGLRDK